MKKFWILVLVLMAGLTLTACDIDVDLVGEIVDAIGDEEISNAYGNYQTERAKVEDEWNANKTTVRDIVYNGITQDLGGDSDEAEFWANETVAFVDNLLGTGAVWEYPIEDPTCSWPGGFNEDTWSWGEWEFHSADGREYHLGLDLMSTTTGRYDTIIRAAADGVVKYSTGKGTPDANGYHIVIEHELDGKTVYSFYGHLANAEGKVVHGITIPAIRAGQEVRVGDPIGLMGTTGTSTGEHLHFAVYAEDTRFSASPAGRSTYFTGNTRVHGGLLFYNPKYVIENDALPQ